MIRLPQNLIKSVADGTEEQRALENYLMDTYSLSTIVSSFAELLIQTEKLVPQPITVTESEFQKIMSLFKIRGQRVLDDGTKTEETRGRRRKEEI
jgi:hypothetical protein